MKKTCLKRLFLFALFCSAVFVLFSCASSPKKRPPSHLIERSERMFWEIQGTDTKGHRSTVYVQGTIHLGDQNLYPVADTVLLAFNQADTLVGEISSADWKNFQTALQQRMIKGVSLDEAIKDFRQFLTVKENQQLVELLGAETVQSLSLFKPWVVNTILSNKFFEHSSIKTEYGLDMFFIMQANQQNRQMDGLDPLSVQLDILSYGTYEEQIAMTKDYLALLRDSTEEVADLQSLYSAYLVGDKAALAAVSARIMDKDEQKNPLYAAFMRTVLDDRNHAWVQKIDGYLAAGGTTFVFAGAAHFTGENSVFEIMKAQDLLRLGKLAKKAK